MRNDALLLPVTCKQVRDGGSTGVRKPTTGRRLRGDVYLSN